MKDSLMNYHDELNLLIRSCHPVLTIISNKETAAATTGAGAFSRWGAPFLDSANAPRRNGVFKPARRRNRTELAGRGVK